MSAAGLHIPPAAAEIQKGAFLSNGRHLYEITGVDLERNKVILENSKTEYRHLAHIPDLLGEPWFLAKRASEPS